MTITSVTLSGAIAESKGLEFAEHSPLRFARPLHLEGTIVPVGGFVVVFVAVFRLFRAEDENHCVGGDGRHLISLRVAALRIVDAERLCGRVVCPANRRGGAVRLSVVAFAVLVSTRVVAFENIGLVVVGRFRVPLFEVSVVDFVADLFRQFPGGVGEIVRGALRFVGVGAGEGEEQGGEDQQFFMIILCLRVSWVRTRILRRR